MVVAFGRGRQPGCYTLRILRDIWAFDLGKGTIFFSFSSAVHVWELFIFFFFGSTRQFSFKNPPKRTFSPSPPSSSFSSPPLYSILSSSIPSPPQQKHTSGTFSAAGPRPGTRSTVAGPLPCQTEGADHTHTTYTTHTYTYTYYSISISTRTCTRTHLHISMLARTHNAAFKER